METGTNLLLSVGAGAGQIAGGEDHCGSQIGNLIEHGHRLYRAVVHVAGRANPEPRRSGRRWSSKCMYRTEAAYSVVIVRVLLKFGELRLPVGARIRNPGSRNR